MQKIGRNDPCPCGSGKKFKHCCEGKKETREGALTKWLGILLIFVLVAGTIGLVTASFFNQSGCESAERVWSPEHGHWHTARNPGANTGGYTPPPPGPAPAGKVWSTEHGHWHDIKETGPTVDWSAPPSP